MLGARAAGPAEAANPEVGDDPTGYIAGSDLPVRVAVVGLRSRGWQHALRFQRLPGCEVVALCDVDSAILARRAAECAAGAEDRPPFRVDTTGDVRTLLAREDVDAIAIATPNHTHAMIACWALDAGKHVYVEKPVSHTVEEGARIVRAAERSGRVCATGTQARSASCVRAAIDHVRAGGLGRVHCSRGLCYKPRRPIGRVDGPQFAPATVDYDRWLGPVAYRPLGRRNLHYDWHWDLATGNGDLGNQGIHQMDIARWALGCDTMPRRVGSIGGRFGEPDDGDSPNTQVTWFDCDGIPLVFEVRGLPRDRMERSGEWTMDAHLGQSIGNVIHGEEGIVRISNSYTWADQLDAEGDKVREWKGAGDHFANFIDAVRAEDPSRLTASIEDGHLSSAYCHLGILSHRLGVPATPDEVAEAIRHRPEAREAWDRMRAHLAANEIDLARNPVMLGRTLEVDPNGETVVGDPGATAMLARAARPPFTF